MRTIAILLVLFLAFVVLVVLFVVSGTYNIAAVEPQSAVVNQLFATLRDQSIARHSQDIQPPSLTDPALVQSGFREYHSMCFSCHGAPGHKPSEIGRGLNPKPPQLDAEAVQVRGDAELYWIIKNGLRMTGMPAFGPIHEEKELWSIVAFLRRLPEMDAQAYDAMVEAAGLQEGGQMHAHTYERGRGDEEERRAQQQAAMTTYTTSHILPGQTP